MSDLAAERRITGRERRQDERNWASLSTMTHSIGHGGHNWGGQGVPPLDTHLVVFLYACHTCDEPLFTAVGCTRRVCTECFPEGLRERIVSWRKRRNRV